MGNMVYLMAPFLGLLLGPAFFVILLYVLRKVLRSSKGTKLQKVDKHFYYREIPCEGRIDMACWLLASFSDTKKEELFNGFLIAYLLRWYKNGYIDIRNIRAAGSKKESCEIDLKDGNWIEDDTERRIYDFLCESADENHVLEMQELQYYCNDKKNKISMEVLFSIVMRKCQEELVSCKQIAVVPSKDYIFIKTEEKVTYSEELLNEYRNLLGLKNFLTDYSLMEEKQIAEVALWEEYLIFANLLGIADVVKKQFGKFYPVEDSIYDISGMCLDNTVTGYLNRMFIAGLISFLGIAFGFVAVLIVMFGSDNFNDAFIKIFAVGLFAVLLGGLVILGWKNRSVKGKTQKTYARITDVRSECEQDSDSDGNSYARITYFFRYEYNVNGTCYSGHGHSGFRKRKNQRIKICYNKKRPQNSETTASRNYLLWTAIFIAVCFIVTIGLCILADCVG